MRLSHTSIKNFMVYHNIHCLASTPWFHNQLDRAPTYFYQTTRYVSRYRTSPRSLTNNNIIVKITKRNYSAATRYFDRFNDGLTRRLIVSLAIVAPPAIAAYEIRTDEKYRANFKRFFPRVYRFIAPYVLPKSMITEIDGVDVGDLKDEIEALALCWANVGPCEETFTKEEVSNMAKRIEDVGNELVKEATRNSNEQKLSTELEPVQNEEKEELMVEEQSMEQIDDGHQQKQGVQERIDEKNETFQKEHESDDLEASSLESNTSQGQELVLTEVDKSMNQKTDADADAVEDDLKGSILKKLESVRSEARSVKSRADEVTDREIKKLEESVRRDLEVVLAQDLSSADIEALRVRVVQLTLELRDRHRWEALRLHELTKHHVEDLVQKYDKLLQEQKDRYEELVQLESAAAASRAAEQVEKHNSGHFSRVLLAKEKQWVQDTKQRLEWQRQELGKKMEERYNSAKTNIESRAAETIKSRFEQLQQVKTRVDELQAALSRHAKVDSSTKIVRDMAVALVDLQEALYSNPSSLGEKISRMEAAAANDNVVLITLSSLPPHIRESGVQPSFELMGRFQTVYKNCSRAAMVPDHSGFIEHAFAYFASALTIGEDRVVNHGNDSQQVYLNKAHELLLEKHDLCGSVQEMSKLSGSVKWIANDWVTSAQDYVAVEKAILFLKLHLLSLSPVSD